jgi:hypothetical protein
VGNPSVVPGFIAQLNHFDNLVYNGHSALIEISFCHSAVNYCGVGDDFWGVG